MDYEVVKKPRILCLHGYSWSGERLRKALQIWPEFVLSMMDLVFVDAPFPAQGEPISHYVWFEYNEENGLSTCEKTQHGHSSSGERLRKALQIWPQFVLDMMDLVFINAPFPAQGEPISHYAWFESNKDRTEYRDFYEGVAYIEDCMAMRGPCDGLLGFSQGAIVAAALPGMQKQGVALTRVPKIKCVTILSGAKLGGIDFSAPKLAENAFSSPIECPSLHFIGEKDFAKPAGIELLKSYVDPLVIHHHEVMWFLS